MHECIHMYTYVCLYIFYLFKLRPNVPFVVYVVAQSLQRAGLQKVQIVGIVLAIHYFQKQKEKNKIK